MLIMLNFICKLAAWFTSALANCLYGCWHEGSRSLVVGQERLTPVVSFFRGWDRFSEFSVVL